MTDVPADPADWRAAVPDALAEIADAAAGVLVRDGGLDADQAAHLGYLIMREIAEIAGGSQIYVPKADSIARHERDLAIWAEYSADRHDDIARRYGLSSIYLYRLMRTLRAEHRARRQSDLFMGDPSGD